MVGAMMTAAALVASWAPSARFTLTCGGDRFHRGKTGTCAHKP